MASRGQSVSKKSASTAGATGNPFHRKEERGTVPEPKPWVPESITGTEPKPWVPGCITGLLPAAGATCAHGIVALWATFLALIGMHDGLSCAHAHKKSPHVEALPTTRNLEQRPMTKLTTNLASEECAEYIDDIEILRAERHVRCSTKYKKGDEHYAKAVHAVREKKADFRRKYKKEPTPIISTGVLPETIGRAGSTVSRPQHPSQRPANQPYARYIINFIFFTRS